MSGAGHVLLLHQLFVLDEEAGGTRHVELARHLVAGGARVTVVASPLSYLTGRRHGEGEGPPPGAAAPGLTVRRVWTWAPRSPSFVQRVASFLSFTATSMVAALRVPAVDVVWGTSPPLFQALGALAVARARGVRFVLEIRDLWPDFAVQLGVLTSGPLIALARAAERFLYAQADAVIVNSPGFIPHLMRHGVPRGRIALVPNGVEVEAFDADDSGDAFREEVGADEETVLVVYTGAHGVPNDLGTLLRAAHHLRHRRDILFVLVGDGRERPRLMEEARDLGLGRVRFVAAQPKARMPEILAAADVCVAILKPIPMFDTTYPNKVFDYMAAARPTVLAIDGVIRRVIEDAGGGVYVPPGDARALADAVASYADDPGRRRADGLAARAYVARHFRRADHAAVLEGVLRGAGWNVPEPSSTFSRLNEEPPGGEPD